MLLNTEKTVTGLYLALQSSLLNTGVTWRAPLLQFPARLTKSVINDTGQPLGDNIS